MQRLREIVAGIGDFNQWAHADKVRLFAWVAHTAGTEHVKPQDFAACYDALHLHAPANIHRTVQALEEQRDLLKSRAGYRLARPVRERLDAKYGARPITVQVHDALASLPDKVSSDAQRNYLDEAMRCFQAKAWRAAAIMAWNLAFDHLCHVIVASKLADFNAAYARQHPKKPIVLAKRSDFQDLKESVVIEIARAAGITDKPQHAVLERNLDVRNGIAHPSAVVFEQPQAEAFILEVVHTIVLGMKP